MQLFVRNPMIRVSKPKFCKSGLAEAPAPPFRLCLQERVEKISEASLAILARRASFLRCLRFQPL
jgi:hypothetical protein